MSSDGFMFLEKQKCFKIWLEVGQYIMQDKRNPALVAEIFKYIVSAPGYDMNGDKSDKQRNFVENLKINTAAGKTKWKLIKEGKKFRLLHMLLEDTKQFCEISAQPYYHVFDWRRSISDDLIVQGENTKLRIKLTNEDLDFFSVIFGKMEIEQETELLNQFTV